MIVSRSTVPQIFSDNFLFSFCLFVIFGHSHYITGKLSVKPLLDHLAVTRPRLQILFGELIQLGTIRA